VALWLRSPVNDELLVDDGPDAGTDDDGPDDGGPDDDGPDDDGPDDDAATQEKVTTLRMTTQRPVSAGRRKPCTLAGGRRCLKSMLGLN
jgi:hypothetical protein